MSQLPPAAQAVRIAGPAGVLEALVEVPAGHDGARCAVLCHPHPLFGGSMHNKVVHMAARAFHEKGYATLRFNFRGVGASDGQFDDGRGETDDAMVACEHAVGLWPRASVSVAGFSFGSFVAFRVALRREVRELVMIAPPVQRFDFAAAQLPRAPWLVIQGDADEVVGCADVTAWVRSLESPPRYELMSGASHFFHGRLIELKQIILDWLA